MPANASKAGATDRSSIFVFARSRQETREGGIEVDGASECGYRPSPKGVRALETDKFCEGGFRPSFFTSLCRPTEVRLQISPSNVAFQIRSRDSRLEYLNIRIPVTPSVVPAQSRDETPVDERRTI